MNIRQDKDFREGAAYSDLRAENLPPSNERNWTAKYGYLCSAKKEDDTGGSKEKVTLLTKIQ